MNAAKALRRLFGMDARARRLALFALISAAGSVALSLYAPVLIGRGVDLVVGAGQVAFGPLIRVLGWLALVTAGAAVFQWLTSACANSAAYSLARTVRAKAYEALNRLPVSYIDSHRHGDILSRLIADVDQVTDGLVMGLAQFFVSTLTILGTIGFMFSLNAVIALIVVLVTPLSLFVARFIATRTYALFQRQTAVRGELTALTNEQATGIKLINAFGAGARAQAKFDEVNAQMRDAGEKAVFYSSLTNPATRFVNSVVYIAVGAAGALAAIRGAISVGGLVSFLSYANQYTKPFNEISGVITELQGALASAARAFELIDETPEQPDAENAADLPAPNGEVSFHNVSFSYDPARPLIQDLNLTAKPGQRIAIVGTTGSGKTTLINLLMRFYEVDGGEIEVSGLPLGGIRRNSLRAAFGMVLQDTWLRAGTIRENIAYGCPDASSDEVVAAARAAHADGFIRRLPKGYDTEILEEGEGISLGQRQLICIARAMLRLPKMLILDEATSSIDALTEIRVQRAFSEMMRGRTSFVVAHRLKTIREADQILVMDAGHIVEQGTHEELIAKNGFYRRLYDSQFSH